MSLVSVVRSSRRSRSPPFGPFIGERAPVDFGAAGAGWLLLALGALIAWRHPAMPRRPPAGLNPAA